jgi:hypothetical protein
MTGEHVVPGSERFLPWLELAACIILIRLGFVL